MSPVTTPAPAAAVLAARSSVPVTPIPLRPRARRRVLILDDDPFVRETAQAHLGGPQSGVSAMALEDAQSPSKGRHPVALIVLGWGRAPREDVSCELRRLYTAPVVPLFRPSVYIRPRRNSADRIGPLLSAIADCRLRVGQHLQGRALAAEMVMRWGEFTVKLEAGDFSLRGQDIGLTRVESAILSLLMRHGGEIVSVRLIEDVIFRSKPRTGSNIIPVHLCRIRAKLRASRSDISIENVRVEGYVLFWHRSFSSAEMPVPELLEPALPF